MQGTAKDTTLQSIEDLRNQETTNPGWLFLYSMYVYYSKLTAEELCDLLRSNKSLTKIKIQANENIDIKFEQVTTSISTTPWFIENLKYLHISSYNLSDSYTKFFEDISFLTNLEYLCIPSNSLPISSGSDIATCITKLSKLKKLDLSYNILMDTAVSKIIMAINSHSIEYINIDNTSISDDCLSAIMPLLSHASTLRSLSLAFNQIDDCTNLANNLFFHHSALHTLNLYMNRLSDLGIQKLLSAIQCNRSILILNLNCNRTSQESDAFMKKWQMNRDNLIAVSYSQYMDEEMVSCLQSKLSLYKFLASKWRDAYDLQNQFSSLDLLNLTQIFRYKCAVQHTLYNEVKTLDPSKTYTHMNRQDVADTLEHHLSHLWRNKWMQIKGIAKICTIFPADVIQEIGSFLEYRDIKCDAAPQLP